MTWLLRFIRWAVRGRTRTKEYMLRRRLCPSCGEPLEVRGCMFHTHDVGYMDGLVCDTCNALWDDPRNSFIAAVDQVRGSGSL